ncbi:MAG: hypothetical protein IJD23_06610 [Spirochaetaceae bacterium]|nr:hypothetical protein [Spirochaetaceae bacterium]
MKTKIYILFTLIFIMLVNSCSSVFSAGVSGKVVDAESTTNPKEGIADVEVYSYVKEKNRDADFDSYKSGSRFSPTDDKYFIGHTTSNSDGTFTLNKLVWEAYFPDFGKTADYCTIYLLFYHPDYGLIKNDNPVIIMSDTTSNVVYQEMKKINSSTTLNVNIIDAGTENLISNPMEVLISVPQNNSTKTYKQTITGNGNIKISYPRFSSGTTENKPNVKIKVYQNGTNQKYMQCFFDKENSNYKFLSESDSYIVQVEGTSFSTDIYVKPFELSVPTLQGQIQLNGSGSLPEIGTTEDDNKKIFLAYKGEDSKLHIFETSSSETTTYQQGDGANGSRITHGKFSDLGTGATWTNKTYTEKFTILEIYVVVDCGSIEGKIDSTDKYQIKTIRSDKLSENLGLLNSFSEVGTLAL